MRFALYGDEAVVDHRFAKIKEAFEQIPGAEVWGAQVRARRHPARSSTPPSASRAACRTSSWNDMTALVRRRRGRAHRLLAGRPADGPRRRRRCTRPAATHDREEAGLDYIAGLLPINARSFVHIAMVIFDTKDEAAGPRAPTTSAERLVAEAAKLGYGEYRAHLDFMDLAARPVRLQRPRLPALLRDDQGRASTRTASSRPGKQGIWPQGMHLGINCGRWFC